MVNPRQPRRAHRRADGLDHRAEGPQSSARNPLVTAERTHQREEPLAATEADLAQIAQRVERGTLTDPAEIGLAVGPALRRFRMKKYLAVEIADGHFAFQRRTDEIAAEQALDGI